MDGPYGGSTNFLMKLHIVFHSSFTNLQFHQYYLRILINTYLLSFWWQPFWQIYILASFIID